MDTPDIIFLDMFSPSTSVKPHFDGYNSTEIWYIFSLKNKYTSVYLATAEIFKVNITVSSLKFIIRTASYEWTETPGKEKKQEELNVFVMLAELPFLYDK